MKLFKKSKWHVFMDHGVCSVQAGVLRSRVSFGVSMSYRRPMWPCYWRM